MQMGFSGDVAEAAALLASCGEATIVSHIDADGITSEAILAQALTRAGVIVRSHFVRQLEPLTMGTIPRDDSLKVFTDLGAGQQNLLMEHNFRPEEVLIIDHHVSNPCGADYFQVNCLPYGHEKLSAAGICYLLARELDESNMDLAKLAVIGNVGDMMAREDCGLVGIARNLVEDGVRHGSIAVVTRSLNCYGMSTRPLHIALAYNDDPLIPGLSNSPNGVLGFLQKLGIPMKDSGGRWLVWEELAQEDQRRVVSALFQQLIAHNVSTERLLAETYLFPAEPKRTPLRNASEFATLLNACGRWARPKIGGSICRGDRGALYREAEHMLQHHRSMIRELLTYILDSGVRSLSHLQYIHVGSKFPDTIIGIGAGMALSRLDAGKPILVMCELPEDPRITKVSMRTTESMVNAGIDLQRALIDASSVCGGAAGGHKIAAGAFIPREAEKDFVGHVNRALAEQSSASRAGHC
jgi:RecJ-like exonuclease